MKKVDFKVKAEVYNKLSEIAGNLESTMKYYVNEDTGEVEEMWATEYAACKEVLDYICNYK